MFPSQGAGVLKYVNDVDEAKEWDLGGPDYSISGKIFLKNFLLGSVTEAPAIIA